MGSRRQKPVIGLVGGIGSGKSTVAAELVKLGCAVIDADAIGHELLGEEGIKSQLRQRWGDAVFYDDGRVNRQALGAVVFNDGRELAELNRILHPAIRHRLEQRIARVLADEFVCAAVLDAAVMIEAGWDDLCTDLVFVSAPARQRQSRVAAGRGWDEAVWLAREKSQISLDTKAAKCKYSVDNSSSVSRLREQVREVFRQILLGSDNP